MNTCEWHNDNIQLSTRVMSNPEFCYNGGVCVLPNRCDCPESWKGRRCEIGGTIVACE
jgi:hypothetical protein